MECPKCGSTNVTSTLGQPDGQPGVWQCMAVSCKFRFNRDNQAKRLGIISR